jgi:hypothetical protein
MSGIGQGIVFKDAHLTIDGVDLSTWVRECTLNLTTEDIESTGMQAAGKEFQSGDRVDSLDVKFKQDFSAAAVDATLFPIFESGDARRVHAPARVVGGLGDEPGVPGHHPAQQLPALHRGTQHAARAADHDARQRCRHEAHDLGEHG